MAKATKSRRKFKSDLSEILNIITHALYSHNEVFLRELISNASDALDKARFEGLQQESLLEGDEAWQIELIPDKEAGTLTVRDNGIGMDREAIVDNLGTIAKSGTKDFLERLKSAQASSYPDLIGQFGVGFYAAFMVAEQVTVRSRLAGDAPEQGIAWHSDGQAEYVLEPCVKATRGTDVILKLKAEAKAYLEPDKLRHVVKAYSDFIQYPITLARKKEDGTFESETLNAREALWLRDKDQIKPEEYESFYQQIANDFQPPARVIHYVGEGVIAFNALLFVPARRPFELQFGETQFGPKLYIKRVSIMDHCEALLPPYLRFVKGVVDCPDLPLNVSRELLQDNPLLAKIQKNLVKAVLRHLASLKQEDYEAYVGVFQQLGDVLKEGLAQDPAHQERIADLVLFQSVNTPKGAYTTLADYVERMPEGQNDIYYLCGESREAIENAPHLEAFKDRGWDVLLLSDPVDEFVLPHFTQYKGKHLKAADKGQLDGEIATPENLELKQAFLPLLEALRGALEGVKEVRLSTRLKDSAACLVSEEGALGAHMERLMRRMGQGEALPPSERILELNPDHAVVKALRQRQQANPNDPKVATLGKTLYDAALIAEGSKPKDPSEFNRRLDELMLRDLLQV